MDYNTLYKYFHKHKRDLKLEMLAIEQIFADAREPEETMHQLFKDSSVSAEAIPPLPIYLTRSRIKSIDSAFLKTKRKDKSEIYDITDMIGIRVLCLFNQNISDVYKFILELFRDNAKYTLTEINIYGWKDTVIFDQIFKSFKLDDEIYNPDDLSSGYKSIHFTGTIQGKDEYRFEIQLRTLLQDVWGEMSHKIAYKQKGSYSYVNDSFHLLSRDLETNDLLLAQLKTFTSEKQCLDHDPLFNLSTVFEYEKDKLPVAFLEGGILRKEYIAYSDLVYENWMSSNSEKLNIAEESYSKLANAYVKKPSLKRDDPKFIYWDCMEKSFYNLASNDKSRRKEAEQYYLSSNNSYVASFRLGQIAIHHGDFVLAMRYFDNCKAMFSDKDKGNSNVISSNIFKVHINMSLIFWNYGNEYLSSAIEEIDQAITIINAANKYHYNNPEKMAVFNAACWYYIEYCSVNNEEVKGYIEKAEEYYNELLEVVEAIEENQELSTRNAYDTLAWYNYSRFLLSKKSGMAFLEKAKELIERMMTIESARINSKSDNIIHSDHEQVVNCAYEKYISDHKTV